MKRSITALLVVCSLMVSAQSHTEKFTRQLKFESNQKANTLIVANINGPIQVEGYSGAEVVVEVTKTIQGKTTERLEEGKSRVKLGIIDRADTLILFVDGLCSKFGPASKGTKRGWNHAWNYQWNDCESECREKFDYTLDFHVKVPLQTNVMVSTINQGELVVQNVKGLVEARNVNGGITITGVEKVANASTVNGDVNLTFVALPVDAGNFYSLNGDIEALFPKELSATVSFESFNGNFYTNVPRIEPIPMRVVSVKAEEGVKYKVSNNRYQIGSGGVSLDFETFNGNVYLKVKE